MLKIFTALIAVTRAQYKLLTDENFEHDTQATTGSTTGDWLLLFCDEQRPV